MTALEEIKKTNHPDRIWATVNGMSTRLPDGARQLVGGWSQDADRTGAVEYVLASTLESLQRQVAQSAELDLTFEAEANQMREVSIANRHRAQEAEAEVKRLRAVVERAQSIVSTSTYPNWHEAARAALASTGGEHHADK